MRDVTKEDVQKGEKNEFNIRRSPVEHKAGTPLTTNIAWLTAQRYKNPPLPGQVDDDKEVSQSDKVPSVHSVARVSKAVDKRTTAEDKTEEKHEEAKRSWWRCC